MPSRVRSTIVTSAESLTSQSFWGASRIRAPLAPPRLSVPRNVAAEAHAVATSWDTLSPDARIDSFSSAICVAPMGSCVASGTGSCHNCGFRRHPRTEAARTRSHVAVRQLVPGFGEGEFELIGVLVESLRDRFVDRIQAKREVSGEHDWGVALHGIVRVGHGAGASAVPLGVHCVAPAGLLVCSHS